MSNYLYNDITLPALPNDLGDFNYQTIVFSESKNQYALIASRYNVQHTASGYLYYSGAARVYRHIDGEWVFDQETSDSAKTTDQLIWTNHDIYTGGDIYLAASDPVPVGGEPEEPEPTALPITPYLPINGAWVKHDIYKQVGNSWAKQPQGAVEVEDGAWSALS